MFVETTFCIDLIHEARRGAAAATAKLRQLGDTPLFASVFVICELQAGARLSAEPERELRSVELLTENFAVAHAEAEVMLRREGNPIPAMDLPIGITAKMRGPPLLARNSMHYGRIPGLVVESY